MCCRSHLPNILLVEGFGRLMPDACHLQCVLHVFRPLDQFRVCGNRCWVRRVFTQALANPNFWISGLSRTCHGGYTTVSLNCPKSPSIAISSFRPIHQTCLMQTQLSKTVSQYPSRLTSTRPARVVLAALLASAICLLSVWHFLPSLEDRFARADISDPKAFVGAIAIGGTDERIWEAGRLAEQFPHLKVVVSGAGTEARVRALLGPGIPADRLLVETQALNTYENAIFTANLVAPRPGDKWLLVTSAFHMPRAIGAFRKTDFDIAPWPIRDFADRDTLPADVVRHEWLGLIGYYILGRTTALFPSATDELAATNRAHSLGVALIPISLSFLITQLRAQFAALR